MYQWTEEGIRAHVFICVLALTVERVMRRKLVGTGTSAPAALERLGRIRAGRARIGRKIVPFLMNVGKPSKECYARPGAMVPKVPAVADIATATLKYENRRFQSGNRRRIRELYSTACRTPGPCRATPVLLAARSTFPIVNPHRAPSRLRGRNRFYARLGT